MAKTPHDEIQRKLDEAKSALSKLAPYYNNPQKRISPYEFPKLYESAITASTDYRSIGDLDLKRANEMAKDGHYKLQGIISKMEISKGNYERARDILSGFESLSQRQAPEKGSSMPKLIKIKSDLGQTITSISSTIEKLEAKRRGKSGSDIGSSVLPEIFGYLAITSLIASFLSESLKLTGFAVGTSSINSSWASLCLFLLGCLFTIFYFRTKMKK